MPLLKARNHTFETEIFCMIEGIASAKTRVPPFCEIITRAWHRLWAVETSRQHVFQLQTCREKCLLNITQVSISHV